MLYIFKIKLKNVTYLYAEYDTERYKWERLVIIRGDNSVPALSCLFKKLIINTIVIQKQQ